MTERGLGVTRACGLVAISRSLYRYRSRRRPDSTPLRVRIEEIAAVKRRYGYRRVYLRLRREGWEVNRKRVYRLYREAGLAVRRRKRKRIGPFERKPLPKPTAANVSWSMDFVVDGLIGGRRLRCLTIVDDCTRECLAIEVDTSITGASGAGSTGRHPWLTEIHHRRQWSGVRRPGARQMVLSDRRAPLFYPSRQAERECLHRKLQRQVP